jgi:hypothetical protein
MENPELLLLEIEGNLNNPSEQLANLKHSFTLLKIEFNRMSSTQSAPIPQNLDNFIEFVSKTGKYM